MSVEVSLGRWCKQAEHHKKKALKKKCIQLKEVLKVNTSIDIVFLV